MKQSPTTPLSLPENKSEIILKRISFALIVIAALFLSIRQIYGEDIGFHLQAGRWMIENLSFPEKDTFTYTANNNDYIDLYWLYQLMMYGIYSSVGSTGIILANGLMIIGAILILFKRVKHSSVFLPWFLLLGIISISPIFEIRPHSLSWLLLSITLYILQQYYEGNKKIIRWLPVVMLLWVNAHSLFILGIVVTGCYAVSIYFGKKTLKKDFLFFSSLAVLCCLMNPYGWRGLTLPFEQLHALQGGSIFKENIREFQSPFAITSYELSTIFTTWHFFDLFVLITTILLILNFRKYKIHEWLIVIAFFYLAYSAAKNIGYFLFAVMPIVIQNNVNNNKGKKINFFSEKYSNLIASLFMLVCLFLVLSIRTNSFYIHYRASYRFGLGWSRSNSNLPVKAVEFMQKNNISGKILNQLDFGGYLEFFTRQKTSIDGRLEVMDEPLFAEQVLAVSDDKKRNLLAKYNPEIILFSYSSTPDWLTFLQQQTGWQLVYVDETSVIYLHDELAKNIPLFSQKDILASSSEFSDRQIDEMIKGGKHSSFFSPLLKQQYYPIGEFNLVAFCFYNGWINEAKQIMANAFNQASADYPELYLNFGTLFFQQKNAPRALFCYEKYLETNKNKQVEERVKFMKTL